MGVLDFIFGLIFLAVAFLTVICIIAIRLDYVKITEENEKLKKENNKLKARKTKRAVKKEDK